MIDLTKYKTVYLIKSVVSPSPKIGSIFTREERFSQLLNTVKSCQRYQDENDAIVIVEGTKLCDNEVTTLTSVDNLYFIDGTQCQSVQESIEISKQHGSLQLWKYALTNIEVDTDTRIVFIAGRYYLAEDFKKEFSEDFSFMKEKSWFNKDSGLYPTSCFQVKGSSVDTFIEIIESSKQIVYNGLPDIEHAFFYLLKDKKVEELKGIYARGFFGSTGKDVIEEQQKLSNLLNNT